jgi:hypothetical protein
MSEDLSRYYAMVELCLKALGLEPAAARGKEPGEWAIIKGSARILIYVQYLEKNGSSYFWVVSPITDIPEPRLLLKFYEEVLETNHTLYGAAFTKSEKWIYLKSIRELKGIDEEEMFNIITRIANYADMYDDVLFSKYGTGLNS